MTVNIPSLQARLLNLAREKQIDFQPKRWFDKLPHSHCALDDAIEQGALFCNLLKEMRC